jgi:CHASE2 domain-containing sensor protein
MLDLNGSNRTSLILYLLITVLVIALFLDDNQTFDEFELTVQDSMFGFRAERPTSGDVLICALDDATIDRIGWPMNRDSLAHLLAGLQSAEAAVIVCDFDWRNVMPVDPEKDDSALMAVFAGDDRVVLPLQFTYADLGVSVPPPPDQYRLSTWAERFPSGAAVNAQALFGPEGQLADSAAALGGITPMLDRDRVVRWSPLLIDYGGYPFASSVLWAASIYWDESRRSWWHEPGEMVKVGNREIPIDEQGRFLLNYHGSAHSFEYRPAHTYLGDPESVPKLTGKIVVIGPTGFQGGVSLATRQSQDFPAVEITATAIENVIHGSFVRKPSYSALFDLFVLCLIGLFASVVLPKISLLYRIVVLGISLFVIVNMQFLLFASFGWLTHAFYPAIEIIFFMAVSPLIKTREEREAEAQRNRKERKQAATRKPITGSDHPATQPGSPDAANDETRHTHDETRHGHDETRHSRTEATYVDQHSRSIRVASSETVSVDRPEATEFVDSLPRAGSTAQMMPDPATESAPEMRPGDQSMASDHTAHTDTPKTPPHGSATPEDLHGTETLEPAKVKIEGAIETKAGQYLGRYRILEEIGRGAMGIVYKGIDPAINRPVALKTLRLDMAVPPAEKEELRTRLMREAQAAGQLSHPNIVTIYDVGSQSDIYYIAMEFLKGYTLEHAVTKKMSLNYKIFAKLMIQVCDALEYAHSNELVHRDVKPANIMVLDNFKVKVMDFGIARMAHSNMTQTGVALGTPSYISPEQLSGHGVDRRSDIYSLGVVMYELLAKEKPFTGDSINKLIFNILNEKPRKPTQMDNTIPEAFDHICSMALDKDPKQRYQYASDVARDLKEFIAAMQPQRMVI